MKNDLEKLALDKLLCPRCGKGEITTGTTEELVCSACAATYPVTGGVPVLLKDASARTKLEDQPYDAGHQIDEKRCEQVYGNWVRVFEQFDIQGGDLLEIGSGTGQLTYGLIKHRRFSSVYASDISPVFLEVIKERARSFDRQTRYFACDANHLPFRSGSFDVVIGNSVLHHFLDYEKTLEQCFGLLRKGGYALFFEPVIQGKAWISFIIDLMRSMDEAFCLDIFTAPQRKKMQRTVRHQTTVPMLKNEREKLAEIEDKYIFDLNELQTLAEKIGFSGFQHFNARHPVPLSYRPGVISTLGYHGISREQVARFDFLFDSFSATYGKVLSDQLSTPMSYFVFRR